MTYMPAILEFLSYDPFPAPRRLAGRLLAKRRGMGWSIRAAAEQIGIDPITWRDWEQNGLLLHRKHRKLLARLLALPMEEID
jgi:hypothetical protein